MKKITNLTISFVLASVLFSGCATTELQTHSQMTQTIFLDPVKQELKTVYIASRNTSGQQVNLESSLVQALQAKGYKVVDDPEKATFVLVVNVLYCNKKQENNAMGAAVAAGATGAGISAYNNGGAGQAIGVGLGAALIGGLIGKATEDTIWQMQVDVQIKEKAKGTVFSSNSTASGQASVRDSQKAGFIDGFGGSIKDTQSHGHMSSNMANSNTQYYEGTHKEYQTVIFAEATKMRLTLEEATPILEKQISNQISGLF